MVSGAHLARQVEMRRLAQRMNAGIGAAGAMHDDRLAAEALDRLFEDLLHREPVRLALPADEAGAVIFERQLVAGHGSTVPARQGEAAQERRASSSAARPGALQQQQPQRALAAGDGERVVEHRARRGAGAAGRELGGQDLDALALIARTRRPAPG